MTYIPNTNKIFTTLTGTEWNPNLSDKVKKTATANVSLSLINTTGKVGMYHHRQDSTGGWTLHINGVAIPVNEDPNATTVVGFVDVGDDTIEYFTNPDGLSGGASAWIPVVYDNVTGNMTETAGIWSGPNGDWTNYAMLDTEVNAGQSVRYIAKFNTVYGVLFFSRDNVIHSIGGSDFGVYVANATNLAQVETPAAPDLVPIPTLNIGEWYSLYRDGTTGEVRAETSVDKVTWTTRYIFDVAETDELWMGCFVYDDFVIDHPEYILL